MRLLPAAQFLALVLALAASASAQDGPEGPAFVEIVSERAAYYAGEPFTVTIRVGIEAEFLESSAIQPFRRELQVPVQIEAPWFDDLPGVRRLAIRGVRAGSGRKLALNEQVTSALPADTEEIGGRPFRMFDLDRRIVADGPGVLTIPMPRLRLAYATRFEESFVEGRVPLDRHDVIVDGTGISLDILPLPDEGRPVEFAGAMGRFAVRATADRDTVDVGDSLQVTVEIDGSGDWSTVTAPALAADAIHVQGVIAADRRGGRTYVYDVEVLRPVVAIPPIPFAFFDPEPPAGYRVVRTAPVPLTMEGGQGEVPVPVAEPTVVSLFAVPTGWILAFVVGAGVLVLLLFAGSLLLLGRRARAAANELSTPLAVLSARLDAEDAPAAALAAYLAAHLDCTPAAVISPDLPARLTAAGVPDALAARTSGLLEGLVAARYGGGAPADAADQVRALAADLDPLLRS